MLVKDHMTTGLVTVLPDTLVGDALDMMRAENIRRMPVVDEKGMVVGIVSERDLLNVSSLADTGGLWEWGRLDSKAKVEEVMTREVITVSPNLTLEDAARIMADNAISGLPVLEGERLVGIITETDLFFIMLEMVGAREWGVRVSVTVKDIPEGIAKVTSAISAERGNILALATYPDQGEEACQVMMVVEGVLQERLVELLEPVVERIRDVRVKNRWRLQPMFVPAVYYKN